MTFRNGKMCINNDIPMQRCVHCVGSWEKSLQTRGGYAHFKSLDVNKTIQILYHITMLQMCYAKTYDMYENKKGNNILIIRRVQCPQTYIVVYCIHIEMAKPTVLDIKHNSFQPQTKYLL